MTDIITYDNNLKVLIKFNIDYSMSIAQIANKTLAFLLWNANVIGFHQKKALKTYTKQD